MMRLWAYALGVLGLSDADFWRSTWREIDELRKARESERREQWYRSASVAHQVRLLRRDLAAVVGTKGLGRLPTLEDFIPADLAPPRRAPVAKAEPKQTRAGLRAQLGIMVAMTQGAGTKADKPAARRKSRA